MDCKHRKHRETEHAGGVSVQQAVNAVTLIDPSSGVCFLSLSIDRQADKMMGAWFSASLTLLRLCSPPKNFTYGPLWQVDGNSHQQRSRISINRSMPLTSASEFLDRSTPLCCVLSLLETAVALTWEQRAYEKSQRAVSRVSSFRKRHLVFLHIIFILFLKKWYKNKGIGWLKKLFISFNFAAWKRLLNNSESPLFIYDPLICVKLVKK